MQSEEPHRDFASQYSGHFVSCVVPEGDHLFLDTFWYQKLGRVDRDIWTQIDLCTKTVVEMFRAAFPKLVPSNVLANAMLLYLTCLLYLR